MWPGQLPAAIKLLASNHAHAAMSLFAMLGEQCSWLMRVRHWNVSDCGDFAACPMASKLPCANSTGPGREILEEGWKALRRGAPDMNSLVAMGACAAWSVSCVAVSAAHRCLLLTPADLQQAAGCAACWRANCATHAPCCMRPALCLVRTVRSVATRRCWCRRRHRGWRGPPSSRSPPCCWPSCCWGAPWSSAPRSPRPPTCWRSRHAVTLCPESGYVYLQCCEKDFRSGLVNRSACC